MVTNGAGRAAPRGTSVAWLVVRIPSIFFFEVVSLLSGASVQFHLPFTLLLRHLRLLHFLHLPHSFLWFTCSFWVNLKSETKAILPEQDYNSLTRVFFFYSGLFWKHYLCVTVSSGDLRPTWAAYGRQFPMAYFLFEPYAGCTDFWFVSCTGCTEWMVFKLPSWPSTMCSALRRRCAPSFFYEFCGAGGLRPLAWRSSFFFLLLVTHCISSPNQKGSERGCLFSKVCAGACFPRSAQNSKVPSTRRRTKNESATSSAASQEMRCSVRSERQVVILATGLLCYWWKFPSSRVLKGVSILRVVCLFLGFQRLTRSFCWCLHEDHERVSALPSGFGGSSTHTGDPAAALFSRSVLHSQVLRSQRFWVSPLFFCFFLSGSGRGRTCTVCPAHIWSPCRRTAVGCLVVDGDNSVSV